MSDVYKGACFCGAVRLEVSGAPGLQGYCHCDDCRSWSGTPVTAYCLWPAAAVKVTAGAEHLATYSRDGKTIRQHCAKCGGAVMTETEAFGMIDVYPPVTPDFPFAPAAHIYYGMRMIDMPDGLPKFRDMPERAGGSGEMITD